MDDTDPGIPPGVELEQLRREVVALRATLAQKEKEAADSRARQQKVAGLGLKLLVPLLDRQQIVARFRELVDVLARYPIENRSNWPEPQEVVQKSEAFATAVLRFLIRRRMLTLFFSLLALVLPVLQLWIAVQQNAIIRNQEKYFNIQVYDIVARSLTSNDSTAKLITGALLAREDPKLLDGIIRAVFGSEGQGVFSAADDARATQVFLSETSARGQLLESLAGSVEQRAAVDEDAVWEALRPNLTLIVRDAAERVPRLLRVSDAAMAGEPQLRLELPRYLVGLTRVMRLCFRSAVETGEVPQFLGVVAPLWPRLAEIRSTNALLPILRAAFADFLVDVAMGPDLDDALPDLSAEQINQRVQEGRTKLEAAGQADWAAVDRLLGLK